MQQENFISQLLNELSYRCNEGYPILSKSEHIQIISEILVEWGLSDIKEELIQNLTEGPNDTEGPESKFTHLGAGVYVKKGDEEKENAQKYNKDDNGTMRPLSADEYEKIKAKQGEEGETAAEPKNAQTSAQSNGGEEGGAPQAPPVNIFTGADNKSTEERYKKEAEAAKDTPISSNSDEPKYDKQSSVVLKRVKEQIEKNKTTLSSDQYDVANKCYDLTQKLFDESISDDVKIELADKIRTEYKITTNASGSKYYINVLGGKRKIFGDGTKSTETLVNQLLKYTQLDQVDFSGIKKNLTAAAKPDLGKEFEIKPKSDDRVKALFQSSPVLSRIREAQHGIFAPKDENGKVLYPSKTYTKEYLQQSFDNPALNKTIELAKEYASKGNLSEDFVSAMESHKKRLSGVLENYKTPSEDLANAIADSYNDLMVDLNTADSESASAVMKQLAENRLYEESLARGEEVYLPSNGTFPGGDIIRVGGDNDVETVSLVSCKFGKEGRIYGCPANMKAITQLHPDESKRDIFGQYVGEKGFTLMVKDELIKGETSEETQSKIKDVLSKSLNTQALSDLFTDEEMDSVSKICSDYFTKLEQTRTKLESELGNVNADAFWGEFQKELGKFKKEYQLSIQKLVTTDKLEKLIGKNNVPNFKTRLSPDVFLSSVLLTENIRSSMGYGLSHNKQYYDENGQPHSKTDVGTDIPDDYSLTIRNERTAGRNGGGIQMSFTGDGERPNGEILP